MKTLGQLFEPLYNATFAVAGDIVTGSVLPGFVTCVIEEVTSLMTV